MTNCEKEQALKNFFLQKKNVLIAFSGGVDSSLLTAFAAEAPIKATAVTLKTELMSEKEIENAVQTAKEIGINHIVLEKSVLGIPEISENRQNRCYVCKKEIFQTLLKFAEENGFETVLEGTNYSDIENREKQNDLRPGFSALLELNEIQKQKEEKQKDEKQKAEKQTEWEKQENRGDFVPKIETPLADLKITKAEIRELAKQRKLTPANKPSMSCLATRFSYDEKLTAETIQTVGAAENTLFEIGFSQARIRCHVDSKKRWIARIEVDKNEIDLISKGENIEKINSLISFLKENGFSYVTIDLEGFRSGSMDEKGREEEK